MPCICFIVSCMYVSQEPVPPVHPPPGWRPKQQAKLFACMECVHAYIHAHMLTCSNVAGCQIGRFGLKTAFVQQCISSTGPARTCLNLIWGGVVFATPCGRCSGRLNTCMHHVYIYIYYMCNDFSIYFLHGCICQKLLTQRLWQCQMKAWNRWGLLDIFHAWWICLYCKGACVHPWGSRMLTWHAHVWWGSCMHVCTHDEACSCFFMHACLPFL